EKSLVDFLKKIGEFRGFRPNVKVEALLKYDILNIDWAYKVFKTLDKKGFFISLTDLQAKLHVSFIDNHGVNVTVDKPVDLFSELFGKPEKRVIGRLVKYDVREYEYVITQIVGGIDEEVIEEIRKTIRIKNLVIETGNEFKIIN
ncbi:hypothetical protein DRQ09_03375, partial [candidate division KSB1 bacterium]